MLSPSSSAVVVSVPTAFALANGVGGYATRPSLVELRLRLVVRLLARPHGTSSGGLSKNEVRAVEVYSG